MNSSFFLPFITAQWQATKPRSVVRRIESATTPVLGRSQSGQIRCQNKDCSHSGCVETSQVYVPLLSITGMVLVAVAASRHASVLDSECSFSAFKYATFAQWNCYTCDQDYELHFSKGSGTQHYYFFDAQKVNWNTLDLAHRLKNLANCFLCPATRTMKSNIYAKTSNEWQHNIGRCERGNHLQR